jgi:hypothetical protein
MLTDPRDELFHEVVEYVLREGKGKASISLIQRKFKIGYQRSARIVDFMYDDGIVGEPNGAHPRVVLITLQQWRSRLAEMEQSIRDSNTADKQPSAKQQAENQLPQLEKFSTPQNSVGNRFAEKSQLRQHEGHATGRSTPPNITPKIASSVAPKTPQHQQKQPRIEAGVGPMIPVDDSMLMEIKPNKKKRLGNEEEFEILHPPHRSPQNINKASHNPFGVVPVADGDVTDHDDAESGEWEYEYVYEEVDVDDEEYGDAEYDEDKDTEYPVTDVNMQYPDEVDLEAGGDWESEEDWDDDEEEYDEEDEWEEDWDEEDKED